MSLVLQLANKKLTATEVLPLLMEKTAFLYPMQSIFLDLVAKVSGRAELTNVIV
ncbi:hypothetical protein HW132_08100 [Brasilonema sp. CT11]|nr:hypothetical protein [Brasilonema sp. CT11]